MSGVAAIPSSTSTAEGDDLADRVIEDFVPLHRCLEWRVSEMYWNARGVTPFLDNEVPFVINNGGRLSDSAARVLFANCLEAPPRGRFTVLEYGAGCGLFARLFLDAFRDLCAAEARDFYDHLDLLVTDGSTVTVEQWREREIFADHREHVITQVLGALEELPVPQVRAAFCNYLLDQLPATMVRAPAPGRREQLCVRTRLLADENIRRSYTRFGLEDFRRRATSGNPQDLVDLFPLVGLFEYEYAFRTEGAAEVPGIDDALEGATGRSVLLNFGAIQCLRGLGRKLSPDGFILLNDYGRTESAESNEMVRNERFGKTSAIRLNFPLIARDLERQGLTVTTPTEDEPRMVHARLVTARPLAGTLARFEDQFGASGARHQDGFVQQARQQLAPGCGSGELFAWCRDAIASSPHDWVLIGDLAEFSRFERKRPEIGLQLARRAVALNPWYSAWLWNIFGDSLYSLERFDEAHEAYLKAQAIQPLNPNANLNLAYTLIRRGECGAALQAIGRGLQGDVTGKLRQRLLELQEHALLVLGTRLLREKARPMRVLEDALASVAEGDAPA
jgi:tetratricopeptide (TPR) repeat protein